VVFLKNGGKTMIRFIQGDILKAQAEALVNTVNCVGVMGRGIALQFKQAFPDNFKAYATACKRGEVQPGRMFVYETGELIWPRYIINFPTKRHWRGKSRLEDIRSGMAALATEIRLRKIRSIAIPPLGSGLGGLSWTEVRPLIEQALLPLPDVEAIVFEPGGSPTNEGVNPSRDLPVMTSGRAALVGLMRRYLDGLMDFTITLLEVHKLMYFLQAAGEPLRLRYVKGPFGPYAENLRHVLLAIEGHLIFGYADDGDAPDKQLALVPGAVADAEAYIESNANLRERFDRVRHLVDGFETPYGLELLATVHWVVTQEHAQDEKSIATATYTWGDRKRQFSREQITLAIDRLQAGGWLSSLPA
jgi:O-acetyl-ADP-ribose deacetylase (regulator of RNase III)